MDDDAGAVRRPPGVTLDTGGTGKGLCADALAHRLAGYTRFVVDCGGDLAIGGVGAQLEPYEVEIEHPLTGEAIRTVRVAAGGVATSGLNVRIWRTRRRLRPPPARSLHRPARVDRADRGHRARARPPSRPRRSPRWRCCSGPLGARRVLAEHGGVIVRDDGDVEEIGPARCRRAARSSRWEGPRDGARDPTPYLWWLVSRAAGIVALGLDHDRRCCSG